MTSEPKLTPNNLEYMAFASSGGTDNQSIREQLEELRKLNSSTASYNKLTIGIALATLIVSIVGVIITLWK